MLSLTLLLLTAPQAATDPAPLSEVPPIAASARLAEALARITAEQTAQRQCHNARLQKAVGPVQPVVGDLLYRDTDKVSGWLLLERSVDGCSIPISWPHSRGATTDLRVSPPVRSGD